ncbi:MAG: DNA-directed RNA polymerase subunit 5 [Barrevirus sp.]|uniref:DNA-directed RNA polymerase subunit 5 n=1 Tax=Barrevirus sp. TaxID=2487763 RepID=A0A3G4ZU31_9VIRU|nr:MAG: DNA-directed RNA polymerase subunit 5 [Barrevirus sp.]
MEQFQIFQVEKNSEDIRRTVLLNTIKMLVERGTIKAINQESILKKLYDTVADDGIYIINKDKFNEGNKEKSKIAIKIFTNKITSISKQSPVNDFLGKHQAYHKILIVKGINTKSGQYLTTTFPETELFLEHELMINLIDSTLVPRYEVLDPNSSDYKTFCELYQCKKRNIPKLPILDPMAKYYGLKRGDIVRVIRPSDTSGYSSYYRIVVS